MSNEIRVSAIAEGGWIDWILTKPWGQAALHTYNYVSGSNVA